MKTQEQLKTELYAPLPAEAIKPHPTKTFLSTIKPIYITDRLNEVFGIGQWQTRTENILVNDNGTVVNKVVFTVPEYNIYYECFGGNDNGGSGSKGFDLGDAFKGATTDALNKIASYLGIGIDVYRGKQSHAPSNNYSKPAAPAPVTTPMTPSKSFDNTDDRKAKALATLKKVKSITDTKNLIQLQKSFKLDINGKDFMSGASVEDIVKLNTIDTITAFYNFVK